MVLLLSTVLMCCSLLASGLLAYFDNSVFKVITNSFPDHAWLPWNFTRPPQRFWRELADATLQRNDEKAEAILRVYIEHLAQENNITELDQWHNVLTKLQTSNENLKYFGGIEPVLRHLFPNFTWSFAPPTSKSQRM